jgi:DNA-binding CsgD family transcriptional regulator/sugar-specific transcriptional regulator TrmB
VSELESLGLDSTCEAVYRAMLAGPERGAADLSRVLGFTESQVRVALGQLADMALLRPSQDNPGRLRPVRPEVGLAILVRRQEDDLAEREARVALARKAVASFVTETSGPGADTQDVYLKKLIGKDAVQSRMEVLAQREGVEFLSVMPGGPVHAEVLESSRSLDAKVLASGATSRILYQHSIRHDGATMAYAKWMVERGAEVRTAALLPPRMVIVDRCIAIVPLGSLGDVGQGAMEVTAEGVVTLLLALFEDTWQQAAEIGLEPPRDRLTGLSEADRQLLGLLAEGLTDEAAANRLGLSVRTVRRTMARLMRELDATSRFEAGLKVQRNWL